MDLSRRGFARRLWRLADFVQASETRRSFRAKAYRRAVWALDDIPHLDASDEEVLSTPGIGAGVLSLLSEYRSLGELARLTALETQYPIESRRLRRLPRMTPAMLHELKTGLGVDTASDLSEAIQTGAVSTIRGVGEQTLNLWRRILELRPDQASIPSHEAWVAAKELEAHIMRQTAQNTEIAGSVRRVEEWVGQLDLVVTADSPEATVTPFLEDTAVLDEVARANSTYEAATHSGTRVVIHLTPPESAGAVLIEATGPPSHVEVIGGPGCFSSEADAYRASGLPWIPPPARSHPVEIGKEVVTIDDLRGDLHLHSDASPDGHMSLDVICEEAIARDYAYILITDHTKGLRFGGLDEGEILTQAVVIESLRKRYPELTIFHGAELNIDIDGGLDLEEVAVAALDFAVAGVHSNFGLDRQTQTARVTAALQNPKVRVLAHPFGRRIGIRPALDIDMEEVIAVSVDHRVALECNGHRDRLDLPADWVRRAAGMGAMFAANSDAHRFHEIDNVANAIATLQRAGIGLGHVVNTYEADAVSSWISSGRLPGRGQA